MDCVSRGQEAESRSVVDGFVEWCEINHLQLNITKTKEMVVDFTKERTHPYTVCIRGTEVGIVKEYKSLGVHMNNKTDWTENTVAPKIQLAIFPKDTQIFQHL